MKKLRLIFMGTPEFAKVVLASLVDSRHEVVAVYTQPPRPAGRGKKDKITPVNEYANSQNIPVYTPQNLKDNEIQQNLKNYNADGIIVAGYGLLLPKAVLEATSIGCINIHPSLLPRWRGAAPIERAIMAGDKETGVVIMQMDEGLDTGDMLMTHKIAIPEDADAARMRKILAEISCKLLLATLDNIIKNKIIALKQQSEGISYAAKINKEEMRIIWSESATSIRNKIRGLSPDYGAYFVYNGENIKILAAEIVEKKCSEKFGIVVDDNLLVATGENYLLPKIVQRSGKKPMPTLEMLRGFKIKKGDILI
ncbi:MAG: methionyl-tRNA formyltransferase [Pseudomonadota bacterium]